MIYLNLFSKEFQSTEVFEEIYIVQMVEGPKGGTLYINSTSGTAMVDKFLISADDWISYDLSNESLQYQYFFTN